MSFLCKMLGYKIPEFKTVLADQYVTLEDKTPQKITLSCEVVKKKGEITAIWKKNNEKLQCVEGKHTVLKSDTRCTLEIQNAEEADEGNYTLTVQNVIGSVSCSAMVYVEFKKPWRKVNWEQSDEMVNELQKWKISTDDVKEFRFLLYGPVGAGKSSIINTIKSIFAGRQYVNCLAAAQSNKSQTLQYEKFVIPKTNEELLPLAFFDMMGLERVQDKKDEKNGVQIVDIIKCLKGHVKEGYTFNPIPLIETSLYYNANPSLNDKMHCLLCVVPADHLPLMENEFFEKMKIVRGEASKLGIPQAVFLTKVDCACLLTKQSLQKVYRSKKIEEKIKECSNLLTVPENCIFPVQNYHRESHMNDDINCLMLDALTHIVHWANDYVEKSSKQ